MASYNDRSLTGLGGRVDGTELEGAYPYRDEPGIASAAFDPMALGRQGLAALYNAIIEGQRATMEQAGSLQRGGSYDAGPATMATLGAVGTPLAASPNLASLGAGVFRRGKGEPAAPRPPLAAELTAAEKSAPYPNAPFPQYATEYPPIGPPTWVVQTDPKKIAKGSEGYFEKTLTPEAEAFKKARAKIIKDMDEHGYTPYFNPEKRFDVDPANYPLNTDTINIVPKTLDTLSKHFNNIGATATREALQNAYAKGIELGGPGPRLTTQDWYMMGQLEQELVGRMGEKAGREAFKERFATPMAATTGGMDPRSNLIASGFHNFQAARGTPWVMEANQWPFPVGARYGKELAKTAQKITEGGGFQALGEANPKRHNFAGNFMGHRNLGTMDEQMTALMQPGKTQPDWYGLNEHIMAQEARKAGVDPRKFQETGWAGFKGEAGGPMIQEVNHTIERIHRLTGMPRNEIVYRVWGTGDIPVYGGAAPVPTLSGLGDRVQQD